MRHAHPAIWGILLLVVVLWTGCGKVEEGIRAIDDAIDRMSHESGKWREILEALPSKLSDEVGSNIRNELQHLIDRTSMKAGIEFKCGFDFMSHRAIAGLKRIRAMIKEEPVPATEPVICDPLPSSFDLGIAPHDRVALIQFPGFDLDHKDAQGNPSRAVLVDQRNCEIPIPERYLVKSTHYLWAVNSSFTNGVPFSEGIDKLRLRWGDGLLAEVSIKQPDPARTFPHTVTAPGALDFRPPLTGGDAEFRGHGPDVEIRLNVRHDDRRIEVQLCMHAKETTHDWSEVDGCRGWETLYTAPSDRRLIRLLSGIPGPWSYRDSGHEDDTIEYPQGMIVRKFVAVGDTVGEEAGSRTSVRAEFQDFQVELESVPVAIRDPSRSPLLCRAGMIFRASEALRKIGDL